jgi:hypothetical protein
MKRFLLIFLFPVSAWATDCHIIEYTDVANVNIPAAHDDGDRPEQHLDDFSTAVDSAPFAQTTRFIGIICDGKTFYNISPGGTNATTGSHWIPADAEKILGVESGHIISVCDSDCA